MVQSRQLVTYRLMESVASEAQDDMEAADRNGLQRVEALVPHDRHIWRSGVRSAMRATSQLSGSRPTDVDVAPVPAR